jgi:hypothetical protein
MAEDSVDISGRESTRPSDDLLALADLLVTVCGHADEHCPIVSPGGAGNTGRCPIRLGRRAARTRSWPNLAGCETGFGSACPD